MTRITLRLLTAAALLAAPLAFTTPAVAADIDEEIQAAAPAHNGPAHEQWEALRDEHQALLAERDRLMERCMDAKGQDKSSCDEKWTDLRARHENWRERMQAFGASKHEGNGKGWHGHHKGMKHEHKADKTNAPAAHADGKMMHHHHHHHAKSQSAAPAPAGDTSGK